MNVRVVPTGRDWRHATATALEGQVAAIDAWLTLTADLVCLLGQELVLEQGTVKAGHLDHVLRSDMALVRSARSERAQQAERLRAS